MRIAYVEDNTTNLALVERVAKMTKHIVTSYTEGEIALEALQREPYDLILMDVELAGELSGLQVVRKLRAGGLSTPIIAVTAYAMMGDRERCIEAGCNDYLPKPLPINDFIVMLAKYDALLNQPIPVDEYLTAKSADQSPVVAEAEPTLVSSTLRTKTRPLTTKPATEDSPSAAASVVPTVPTTAEAQPSAVKPADVSATDTKPAETPVPVVKVVEAAPATSGVTVDNKPTTTQFDSKPSDTTPAVPATPSGLTPATVAKAADAVVETGIKPPLEPLSPKVQEPVSQAAANPVTAETPSASPKDAASVTQSDAAH